MHIPDERLPGDDAIVKSASADAKAIRLTLTSRHIVNMSLDTQMTMFGGTDDEADDDYDDIPEGFDPENIADFDEEYDYSDESEDPEVVANEFLKRLEELVGMMQGDDDNDEDDSYVFKTIGEMRRAVDRSGEETIEITYTESESLDNARTMIAYTPLQNGRVSIIHDGAVMSSLVCERGVRHISVYKTALMPFEVAVYTKKCEGNLTFESGGYLELDYLVELRGMDIQRTKMTINVLPLE